MRRRDLWIAAAAALALLGPAAWNAYDAAWRNDWRAHPRFDGQRYVTDREAPVPQRTGRFGAAATLATLRHWQGRPLSEAAVQRRLDEAGFDGTLDGVREAAARLGFEGRWVEADPAAVPRLNVPFVAHLREEGGRLLLVRQVRDGYVYATDPTTGQVLYPLQAFAEAWTGRALAFPDPPPQPEPWR